MPPENDGVVAPAVEGQAAPAVVVPAVAPAVDGAAVAAAADASKAPVAAPAADTPEAKAAAEKAAADAKAVTDKAAADKAVADKAVADKAAADKAAADKAAADKAAAAPKAPEKYEAFKAPAGVELDPKVVTEFEGVAKELGLTQEAAQKLVDKLAPVVSKQNAEGVTALAAKASEKWMGQSKADKEFGGDAFDANLATALKAFDAFGTPELKTLLNASGLGNHPELIRWAYRVGKAIAADGKVVAGSIGAGARSIEDKLWGGSKTKAA